MWIIRVGCNSFGDTEYHLLHQRPCGGAFAQVAPKGWWNWPQISLFTHFRVIRLIIFLQSILLDVYSSLMLLLLFFCNQNTDCVKFWSNANNFVIYKQENVQFSIKIQIKIMFQVRGLKQVICWPRRKHLQKEMDIYPKQNRMELHNLLCVFFHTLFEEPLM